MESFEIFQRRNKDSPLALFNSGAPATPRYRKEKEAHNLIVLWLSWLAVLLVVARDARRRRVGVAQDGYILQTIGCQRHGSLVYHVLL